MSDVTVICCWTNEKQYQDFVNTLKAQTIPYELIGIDNRGNKAFTSCAAAYNSVINRVSTKYVIYSHQDILLNEPDMLAKFVSYLERTNRDDILGVAGTKFTEPGGFSNITHRNNQTGELVHGTAHFLEGGMMECDTVDECFFGGHAEHFRDYPFDEIICDNWHLYAAEACLHTQSLPEAGRVYVCDVPLLIFLLGQSARRSDMASTSCAGNTRINSRSFGQPAQHHGQILFTHSRSSRTCGLTQRRE